MTIVLQIPAGTPPPDPELAAAEHEAQLIAQVRNATIAECQRYIRDTAEALEIAFRRANLPTIMATAYRSAADLLEVLRS
jgi:hypothetical protein